MSLVGRGGKFTKTLKESLFDKFRIAFQFLKLTKIVSNIVSNEKNGGIQYRKKKTVSRFKRK